MKIRDLIYEGRFTEAYLTVTSEWEKVYVVEHFEKIDLPIISHFFDFSDQLGNGDGGITGQGRGDGGGMGLGGGYGGFFGCQAVNLINCAADDFYHRDWRQRSRAVGSPLDTTRVRHNWVFAYEEHIYNSVSPHVEKIVGDVVRGVYAPIPPLVNS